MQLSNVATMPLTEAFIDNIQHNYLPSKWYIRYGEKLPDRIEFKPKHKLQYALKAPGRPPGGQAEGARPARVSADPF